MFLTKFQVCIFILEKEEDGAIGAWTSGDKSIRGQKQKDQDGNSGFMLLCQVIYVHK